MQDYRNGSNGTQVLEHNTNTSPMYMGGAHFNNNNNNNNNNYNNNTLNSNSNGNVNNSLSPEPSIEVIKQALIALYKSGDTNIRDTAQNWLMKFQTLPIAWDFCSQLIYSDIFELQYFGASTLEKKLKIDWKYLNKEIKGNILKIMVEIVQNSNKVPKCVITRICVALSIVVMYNYPDVWPNAIIDVIQLSCPNIKELSLITPESNLFDFNRLFIVLEFLTILPQELRLQNISVSHKTLLNEIKKIIDLIYHYLLSILCLPVSKYKEEVQKSFRAISTWIKYLLPSAATLKNLFHICFNVALSNPVDLVEELVVVLEGSTCTLDKQVQTSNNSREAEEAYRYAVENSLANLPHYFKDAMDKCDTNKAKAIFNLFVQYLMCNNENVFCKEILTKHLDLLLKFSQIADIEINSLIFPLLEDFKQLKGLQLLDKSLLHMFLVKLFDRFLELSMLPMDFQPNDKEDHDLKEFRVLSSDGFLHILCIGALPKPTLHRVLLTKLEESIKQPVMTWQVYESILYYLTSLSDQLSEDSSDIVTKLLNLLPLIPTKSLPLIRCSIRLVSKYPFYLRDKPEYLNKVVLDLIPAFNEPDLIHDAAASFAQICINTHCANHLLNHIHRIIDLCLPALSKQQTNPNIILIYEGILRIAQHITNAKELSAIFEKLIVPVVNNLKLIIQNNNHKDKQFLIVQVQILESVTKIIEDYDDTGVSTNINNDKKQHPLYSFLQILIPIFGFFFSSYKNDLEVIDLIAKPYRWMLIYCKSISFDFLLPILQQVTNAYTVSQFPSLLQVVNAMVSHTSLQPDQERELRKSITLISQVTLQVFKQGVALSPTAINSHKGNQFQEPFDPQYVTNFSINPDLTTNYLNMISLCYKKNPQCLDPGVVNSLVIYIIYNLLDVTNHLTIRICWTFLSNVILSNKSSVEYIKTQITPLIDHTISQQAGKVLARNLLIGMTSAVPTSLLQSIADVSLAFCTAYSKLFRQEATKLLHHPDFPNKDVELGDKQKFLSELQRVNDPVEYRYSIRTFAILCGSNSK